MKKIAKTLLLFAAGIFSLPMFANQDLVVNFTDGSKVRFSLGEEPVITYVNEENNHGIVVTTASKTASYEFTELASLTFAEAEPDGVSNVNTNNGFKFEGQTASFSGLDKGSEIRIYDANGRLIQSQKAEAASSVNLSTLPAGIYIVKFGNQSFKVKK